MRCTRLNPSCGLRPALVGSFRLARPCSTPTLAVSTSDPGATGPENQDTGAQLAEPWLVCDLSVVDKAETRQ